MHGKRLYNVYCVVLVLVLVAACGQPGPAGDPVLGRQIFSGEVPIAGGSAPACSECHAVVPNEPAVIGTNLSDIADRAATTVPNMSAVEYLRSSIVDPDAYLAGGFQEGIHYRGYGQVLTEKQINDLIAYLQTLKNAPDNADTTHPTLMLTRIVPVR